MSTSVLSQYKRPNGKIKALKDKSIIKSVKRGIYIPRKTANMRQSESGLIGNPHGTYRMYQRIQQHLLWRLEGTRLYLRTISLRSGGLDIPIA